MIGVLFPAAAKMAGALVISALRRSVTRSLACSTSVSGILEGECNVVIAICPDEVQGIALLDWIKGGGRKLILLGNIPEVLMVHCRMSMSPYPPHSEVWSKSSPALPHAQSESSGNIKYTMLAEQLACKAWKRPLERFDFMNEWNNLGYGAIRSNGSIWSVAASYQVPDDCLLAGLYIGNEYAMAYSALFDEGCHSILWFNRPVGPVDSFEWRLIEYFISSYRGDFLPCHPVLREIPWGYDAAITMRVDCDEDCESARSLWLAYKQRGIPFSMAIHTRILADAKHFPILKEVLASGGSILSHSATHAPNWGGSYDAARWEAQESAACLEQIIGQKIHYAVSPFHQTPHYALEALLDVGYRGCIGGIIRNDPDFMMARGGGVAGLSNSFVGHSQQCMLHGDCMLNDDQSVQVYFDSFDLAYASQTIFGYLDHPFSERYSYGWLDEDSRIQAHLRLIEHINTRANTPLFLNEVQAMDFLYSKSQAALLEKRDGFVFQAPKFIGEYGFGLEYKGYITEAQEDEVYT